MIGLLAKARKLRSTLGLSLDARDEFAFDPDSGITREEQAEIRKDIEKIATQSRIAVSPEAFAVKAAKRGVLFPILVNVAAVAALTVGIAVFYFLFQRGETQLARENAGNITAEGTLINELKKESEAKLQEKNQQINQIQGQLADLDKQRLDLQSNMDAKVRDRESQLRAALSTELEAEKARLQKQGLSDQDIQKKLADLEAQKNASFTKELDSFRVQAESERLKSEANLKSLQAEFNANLDKANAERQQVLSDSKKREADLQAQLEIRTKELQSAQAQTQQQLTTLASEKQREDLVSQQLVGLYSVVKTDIAARNYAKALTSLQAIGAYVNSSDVAVLPGIAKRREVDLFIVESLSGLVLGEIDKGKTDTASLVAAANQISEVRAKVTDADSQLRAGKVAEAEKLYAQAIAVVPEIARSYAYFTAKARDAETARQEALRAALGRAESAFEAARYPEMTAAYREALAYLPEPAARLDRTLANLSLTGAAQADQKSVSDQSRDAAVLAQKGAAALAQGQHDEALAQYLQLLEAFPRSSQAPQAIKGARDAVTGLSAKAAAQAKAQADQAGLLSQKLAAVQKQLDAGMSEILAIKKTVIGLLGSKQDPATADSAALMSVLTERFGSLTNATSASADLRTQLASAQKRSTDLGASVSQLTASNAKLARDLRAAQQEAEQQAARADQAEAALKSGTSAAAAQTQTQAAGSATAQSAVEDKRLAEFDALVKSYLEYAAKEDANISANEQKKGLMLTVGTRNSFLASLGKFFDGILGRVQRYEIQSSVDGMETGRKGALDDVIAVMTGLANQKTPETQKSYLDGRIKAAEKDPKMQSLLGYLQQVVSKK
jgi:hypothetical protein